METTATGAQSAPTRSTATIGQTKQILRELWGAEDDEARALVPMLWGDAGIGKTSLVAQAARETSHERVVKVLVGKMRPEDFAGVPFPYKAGYTRYHVPKFLFDQTAEGEEERRKQHARRQRRDPSLGDFRPMPKTVLFLDELNLAHEDMQGATHQAIEERKIGAEEFTLHDNVRVVAAGNEAKAGFHARPLSLAMLTRLAPHVDVAPSLDEWVQWARGAAVHPTIVAYLQQHPEVIDTQRDVGAAALKNARGIATRRTWAKASAILKSVRDDEALELALEGAVGRGPASELLQYHRTMRKVPTVDEIAQNPTGAPTFDQDPDCAHLVVENLIAAVRRNPKRYAKPLIAYADRLHNAHKAQIMPVLMGAGGAEAAPEVVEVVMGDDDLRTTVSRAYAEVNLVDRAAAAAFGDPGATAGANGSSPNGSGGGVGGGSRVRRSGVSRGQP